MYVFNIQIQMSQHNNDQREHQHSKDSMGTHKLDD